jgi:hypothetical protein
MHVLVLLRPTMARFAPSAASASAAANPMPLVAPVIRICLSFPERAECLDRGATQDQRTAASSLHPHTLVNDLDGLATGDVKHLPAGSSRIQFFNHDIFFRCQTAPLKYSYMLGGMFSSCSSAMCLRTISEYKKRSPQMRQCHWSRTKMYGRHSELFGSSLGWGIFKFCKKSLSRYSRARGSPN